MLRSGGQTLGDSHQCSGIPGEHKADFLVLFAISVIVFILRQSLGWKYSEVAPQLVAHAAPSIPCPTCPSILCLDHRLQVDGEENTTSNTTLVVSWAPPLWLVPEGCRVCAQK